MPQLTPESLEQIRQQRHSESKGWIKVGMSTCGLAAGAGSVFNALVEGVKVRGLDIEVRQCGCSGACYCEPLVEINVPGVPHTTYGNVNADVAQWLLDAHACSKRIVEKYVVPGLQQGVLAESEIPVAGKPTDRTKEYRIVLRNCAAIDPLSIEEYIGSDGYQALRKVLWDMTPQEAIGEILASGLRGRGGAGFLTGLKWRFTREAEGNEKFVICNGDEGDPGAYMDRSVLEGDPHAILEGMIISGYAIGASEGFFYIRAEYPLAVERIENAIRQAKRYGLLGKNILGSGFDFNLEVRLGAGAFVCGEETALIASIEGKRGTPRPRPPFPSVSGLFGKPTCINNVETLANIPRIIHKGSAWFASIGTEKSKGTKVFAITGKVKRSGLVEIPMGVTLRQIVMDLGGGSHSGKPVKAVQTGGPSGGVIPASLFDTPVDFEHLGELGSIMGSGGLIVMEEGDSMIELARYYLDFCVDESCGKCAPCRIGGRQMLVLMDKINAGKGTENDIKMIRDICQAMWRASLCALGQTAPKSVLSTLRYFENEYRDALRSGAKKNITFA